jgi:gliding motility-associated-like protein
MNDPPRIQKINDTCVVAGSSILIPVIASDPNQGQSVTLSAYGGPLELSVNPATFIGGTAPSQITGTFQWQTVCDHIRRSFYQIVFKAEDNYTPVGQPPVPLSYLETWIIKIVAPAPQNLTANAQGNNIILNWNSPYACDTLATRKFIGFSVWRREGSNPFPIDTCVTGLAGRGYTKITSQNIREFTYTDSTARKGKNYCYRILAEFAEQTSFGLFYNRVESLPSNEACSELKRDVPLIENVDVLTTDAATGKIFVRWFKPIANVANLDTTQFPGPYRFDLKRSEGFDLANPTTLASFSSNSFLAYNDTTYTDSLLNTVDNPYSYTVDFYSNGGNVLVGSAEPASSVYMTLAIGNRRMTVEWGDSVPWLNTMYYIFREDFGSGTFNFIDSTTASIYVDTDLINDTTYCYYVRSKGAYTLTSLVNNIIFNNSQIACAIPSDTAAPCPPNVTVLNRCTSPQNIERCPNDEDGFQNTLKWNTNPSDCDDDVAHYNVYYSAPEDSLFTLIETTTDTTYLHVLSNTLAGCYYLTAVDSTGNESVPGQTVCVDNCPCYILPNVFTPNGDNANDIYTPILPYQFVASVEMKIYTRWGNLVFETTDPMINWDGKDQKTKKDVKEGVYFYVCKVFESRVDGVKESTDIRNGFIHVIKGK